LLLLGASTFWLSRGPQNSKSYSARLSPWNRVRLETLIITHFVKKLPFFYGTCDQKITPLDPILSHLSPLLIVALYFLKLRPIVQNYHLYKYWQTSPSNGLVAMQMAIGWVHGAHIYLTSGDVSTRNLVNVRLNSKPHRGLRMSYYRRWVRLLYWIINQILRTAFGNIQQLGICLHNVVKIFFSLRQWSVNIMHKT
jgi:hypothetical protein